MKGSVIFCEWTAAGVGLREGQLRHADADCNGLMLLLLLLLQVEATPAWHLKVALPETVAESFTSRNREENGETRASSGLSGSQGRSLKYSKFCCLRKRLVKLLGRAARGFRTSIPAARSCRTDYPASRIEGPAETNLHEDWTSYITC